MKTTIDKILSDKTIKFNNAIKLLRNELEEFSENEQNKMKEDFYYELNFNCWGV